MDFKIESMLLMSEKGTGKERGIFKIGDKVTVDYDTSNGFKTAHGRIVKFYDDRIVLDTSEKFESNSETITFYRIKTIKDYEEPKGE